MDHHSTVLVIGGGVIGASIALELAKQGSDSTILDKGDFCGEATTASAGMFCPQAVRFDTKDKFNIFREGQKLQKSWIDELEDISHIPVQYVDEGMIRTVSSEHEAEKMKGILSSFNHLAEWLDANQVNELEKSITNNNFGGLLFPEDGQLHPIYLAKSLYKALQRMGCHIKQSVIVHSLIIQKDCVIGAHTSKGDFFADHTIIAAGAWSSALIAPLGAHLPVFPVKGQMYAVRSESLSIKRIVQGPNGMIIPRLDGTFTVGVTHEEVGYDKESTVSGISQVHKDVSKFIPELWNSKFITTWAGLRPGTPDGLPYIGELEGFNGLVIATGHYSIGILLAPITAKLVTQMIIGKEPNVDMQPFYPGRFQDFDPNEQLDSSGSVIPVIP